MSEMTIEVIFALPQRCWREQVRLFEGATAQQALDASGLEAVYREAGGEGAPPLGLFGRKVRADQVLKPGDRVEIYRPLTADPRQRRRAQVDARRRKDRSGAG
ncbi:hypothetical protein SADO_01350 [Salinisphaera dokdonensis CL-ES53]|uniref:UPF0125 protein SADO_01350 n=1 Tax=Salinisphaera dokdonensis CL-ES53 TaxID=1304272 RepID=A0ABV2AW53_9GAMM